jgi:hypothetical protein
MDSLTKAYQGIFGGTRIATAGFAKETAGLGCPNFARLGRRGAACPRNGPDSRAGRSRVATSAHGTLEGESPKEILTMPDRSISDRTPLYGVVILAVGLGIVVSAMALLALIFFF